MHPEDHKKCEQHYLDNQNLILDIKEQVMPHYEKVIEAREKAEDFISNIGDELDPNKEQEDEECEAEGVREHPNLDIKDPTGIMEEEPSISQGDRTFRKIELQNNDQLYEKIRTLDPDQKKVFDIGLEFAKNFMKARKNSNNKWPVPPLLGVHGGAGSGKSHVIDVLSQMVEKIFRSPGDNPNSPYVLKLAFTGNAASIIKGQTLHSAFNFKFNNQLIGLSDKLRDLRRKQLDNLKLIIIDEISLVKSDLPYQLDFRLQKDIFQNNLTFGGLAVIVFGDILQIRPPSARHVFLSPQNPRLQLLHEVDNLWKKFKVVILKTNHRQGEDKIYADILNRIRVDEQTKEDIKLLKTRVFPRNSKEIPQEALLITGTNKIVNKVNNEKLNLLPGELYEFKTQVSSNTRGIFVPKIDNAGQVKGTTLQYELKLKLGCRVMLTWNIDVCDGLANGSLGQVIDFKFDSNKKVRYVMVKFNDPNSGKERRQKFETEKNYPGENATPIEMIEFEFTFGEQSSATATATNFPLRLAYASTAHKIQGHTVLKPSYLILDLKCWLEPAMIYVMLSRVQCLKQLFILESLPEDKMRAFPEALEEWKRLQSLDISKPDEFNPSNLKITSLNTRSLNAHIDDIKKDRALLSSDVICLQETWVNESDKNSEIYLLREKQAQLIKKGKGKGTATYHSSTFELQVNICEETYQLTSITSTYLTVINLYRSSNCNDACLIEKLTGLVSTHKSIILCGDFNICQREQMDHQLLSYLRKNKFIPGFDPPQASHMSGRCLDQVYTRLEKNIQVNSIDLQPCYFSDHDKVILTLCQGRD